MPYVKKTDRLNVDEQVYELLSVLEQFTASERDGMLNYAISSIINGLYEHKYVELNAAIGVLECAKLELYRRVVAPYEDTKIVQNGDVY